MLELDRVWLAKAAENLEAAESDFAGGRYNGCANRCYYACFQAAVYALIRAGVRPRDPRGKWGHDFVQAEFHGQLITRRKLYPPSLRGILEQNYELRATADYTTIHVTRTRAARAVTRMNEFVRAIRAASGDGYG